jgi:chromosome segregation protein
LENDRLALANIQRETDRSQQKLDQIKNLISARQFQIEKLIKRIESEEGVIEKLEEESIFLQSELEKSKNILDAMPTLALSEQRERQIQQLDSAKTILAGRKAVVDSRNSTLNQVETLLSRRTERLLGIQEQLNQLELEDNQVKLTAIEQVSKMSGMKLAPIRTELADERQGLSRLELKADNIRGKGHELETRFSKARIELGQAENLLESLKERISADLGMVALSYEDNQPEQSPLPMDDIVEHLPEVDELPDDIEDTISRYRGQLTRIGGINPEAPAEYEATLLRYDHLREQIEDLIDTQDRLRSVIEELDEKTSQAFADTVRKVDAVFGDVFKRLFGGGSAKLILTEPENLVDSGVEIVARLPRRREQGLALLSGGERSLTAAALVFALLKVSPTPFCVLDEVDAMLDEANVNRFRDLLQELSRRTQFILITHNRGTVQVAESVYGVSMGSDSVSQVISVKPEDYLVGDQAAP